MATQRKIESLTYREKLRDGAHLTRELIEHFSQSLEPKIQRIKTVVRTRSQPGEDDVPDVTVRNLVATVMESERFASELCERLEEYSRAIVSESENILEPKQRPGRR